MTTQDQTIEAPTTLTPEAMTDYLAQQTAQVPQKEVAKKETPTQTKSQDADIIARARDALTEQEFNSFVESLTGDDEGLNTETIRDIARKINKGTFKSVAEAKRIAEDTAETVRSLQKKIVELEEERVAAKAARDKELEAGASAGQFQKLSEECKKNGVDLEESLGDAKVLSMLSENTRDSKTPFTYKQEITAFIAKGMYEDAARVLQEVVNKVGGGVTDVTISPAQSQASTTPVVEVGYEEELMGITRNYATSNKTFADMKMKTDAINALRKKHGK